MGRIGENWVETDENEMKKCRKYKGFTIEITIEIRGDMGNKWMEMENWDDTDEMSEMR